MTQRIAYTLEEAAQQVGLSEKTLRRAIHATDPNAFPHPLPAVRLGKGYRVLHDDLVEWARRGKPA